MSRKGPNSVLIISARFYEDIADELARGAMPGLCFARPGLRSAPKRSFERHPFKGVGDLFGTS